MKLSEWARENNLTYTTAYKLFKNNQLPVKATQLPTGTILIDKTNYNQSDNNVVLYARVSSHDQKHDLQRQLDRLRNYASHNGYIIVEEISEIASGMNSKRPKLNKLLNNADNKVIIVEHKDRLSRFGYEIIENILNTHNRKIVVINETESEMDLVQDFIDIVTSMCSRIYGKRSGKNKAQRAMDAVKK